MQKCNDKLKKILTENRLQSTIKVGVIILFIFFSIYFVSSLMANNWYTNDAINASLPDIGNYLSPKVFYMDESWYLISGSQANFYGYVWNGSDWKTNTTINATLPNHGYAPPEIFFKDSSWYLIAFDGSAWNGYTWTAGAWASNSTIVSSLPDIGDSSGLSVFQMYGSWYLLAGAGDGKFYGYNWNGTQWLTNTTINATLPDIGAYSLPDVFYKDSSWYLISGGEGNVFYGYTWTAGAWETNLTINASLENAGGRNKPSVFYKNSTWYLISGTGIGDGFNGFNYYSGASLNVLVNLTAPENNSIISETGANFSVNLSITGTNYSYSWINNTYHVWFSNGTLFNQTIRSGLSGNQTNISQFIDNFILGNYKFNSYACYGNGTINNCSWSNNGNVTFTIGATILVQSFNNYTYETKDEIFGINISLFPGVVLYNQELIYNGSSYSGSQTALGSDDYYLFKRISVPLLNPGASFENKSFFWRLTFRLNDGSFVFQNLTSTNQGVLLINFSECATGNTTLNFTAWNEEDFGKINPYKFYGTFYYWLDTGDVKKNISFSNTNINEALFCIGPSNITFYSSAQIQYEKDNFVKRSHYLINASLTNATNNISLFLLNLTKSTSFIIDVVDQNQIPQPGVYVVIQRYYPGSGIFQTVEMAQTDAGGSTIGHFEAETEDYKIIIQSNQTILLTSGVQKVFCRENPCTLTFTIGSISTSQWENFGNLSNFVWSLEFDNATKMWTYTYLDVSGIAQYGRLLVYKDNPSGKSIICNTSSASVGATLTCNVTGQEGTIYAAAYISRSPEVLVYLKSTIVGQLKNILGKEGLFLSMFILMLLAFAGLWNPVVGIVLVVAGFLVLSFIGLASFGSITIWAIIFIALIILWELKS